MLMLWDQAGERPYEVLIQEGLYDEFMDILSSSSICTNANIYRGTMRHLDLQVGDFFTYDYPTSWTKNIKVATNFIDPGQVILCIKPSCLKALPNPYNSYGEEEFILHPTKFQVSSTETYRGTFGNYTLVNLKPV